MDKRTLLFSFLFAITFFAINSYFFPPQKQVVNEVSLVSNAIEKTPLIKKEFTSSELKETFYLLENAHQQVVFSNIGGAIAEINLPLNKKEVSPIIKEISPDAEIKSRSPHNALFPLGPCVMLNAEREEMVKEPVLGGYTPLLRRSLKNEAGKEIFTLPPRYYAMNLVDAKEDSLISYQMTHLSSDEIEFTAQLPNRTIVKKFRQSKNAPYILELDIAIEGDTENLWLSSGLPEVELISGSYTPLIKYCNGQGNKAKVKALKLPKLDAIFENITSSWASNSNGYFGIITNPLQASCNALKVDLIDGVKIPTRLSLIDPINDLYPTKNFPSYEILVPYKTGSVKESYRIFAGPYDNYTLKQVDASYSNSETSSNYGLVTTIQGWFSAVSEPFAKFLSIFLNFFYAVTGSWGFSIILLTFTLRLMLFPLNSWSYKSNLKMQKIQPKLKALQDKYKKDPKRLQMEMMLLYKNEKVNPLSPILPFLIQIPFFLGLFDLLKTSFGLRGASFIPGWIDNLTAPDILFSWSTPLWFFGTSFHLLPIISGALMFLQQRLSSAMQQNATPLTEQQKQMRMVSNIMAPVFVVLFYNMPSGLNIYWIFSTIFGILQEWLMRKRYSGTKSKTIERK